MCLHIRSGTELRVLCVRSLWNLSSVQVLAGAAEGVSLCSASGQSGVGGRRESHGAHDGAIILLLFILLRQLPVEGYSLRRKLSQVLSAALPSSNTGDQLDTVLLCKKKKANPHTIWTKRHVLYARLQIIFRNTCETTEIFTRQLSQSVKHLHIAHFCNISTEKFNVTIIISKTPTFRK